MKQILISKTNTPTVLNLKSVNRNSKVSSSSIKYSNSQLSKHSTNWSKLIFSNMKIFSQSNYLNKNNIIIRLLTHSFRSLNLIIAQPILSWTTNTLTIKLFCLLPKTHSALNHYTLSQIHLLINKLAKLFNITIICEIIGLNSYSADSSILSQALAIITDKNYTNVKSFRRTIMKLFNFTRRSHIKALTNVTGISIKLAGRLTRQAIIPKRTVKTLSFGFLSNSNVNYLTNNTYIAKNKRGSFAYSVTIGHKFF